MKDYTNNTPIFSEALKITETSDPAHADVINTAPDSGVSEHSLQSPGD